MDIRKYSSHVVIVVLLSLLFSCGDKVDVITNPAIDNSYGNLNFDNNLSLYNYPTYGSFQTDFSFVIAPSDEAISAKYIKYDFDNDKEYDTVLTVNDTLNTRFTKFGYNTIIATTIFSDNSEKSCSTNIWATQPVEIINDGGNFYEPDIYNGNKIAVVHGSGHQTQLYDLENNNWECYFCDSLDLPLYREMHYPVLSFDETKLLFDNGHNSPSGEYYPFCLYDLSLGKIIMEYVPINVKYAGWSKICFSFDDKSLYYIEEPNKNYDDPGRVRCYTFETEEDKVLLDKADEICAVPWNTNQIAAMLGNKLTIFNINTNSIEKEYDNLPSSGMFRMVNENRIFFKEDLLIYNLDTGISDYIRFAEFDLEDMDDNDVDITYLGNKMVLNEWWNDNPKLYLIYLPNYF